LFPAFHSGEDAALAQGCALPQFPESDDRQSERGP